MCGNGWPIAVGNRQEVAFQYKYVELALANAFGVEPLDLPAFRARLRHLRNLGVPAIPRPGTGHTIAYGRSHAIQMLVALELELLGLPPKLAAGASLAALDGRLAEAEKAAVDGKSFFVRVYPSFEPKDGKTYLYWGAAGDQPASIEMHRAAFVDLAKSIGLLELSLNRLSDRG
jgi:hypothetical protein